MKEENSSPVRNSSAAWVPFFVLLCACLGVFCRCFYGGALIMLDNPVHVAQIKLIIRDLIASYGWLCGWSHADFAGFDSLM